MIAIRRSLLVLAAGVLACAALGYLFRTSHLRGASIREQLAALGQTSQPPQTTKTTPPAVAVETNPAAPAATAEHRELAERAALLDAARRVPEVARREAALRVIKRIQAGHAATPPAPKPLPPPVPRDGVYFAELLADPEYLQLVAERWRITQAAHTEQRLATLGVPEGVRSKIVELEFDSYAARLEMQRYARLGSSEQTAAISAITNVATENDAMIQSLLGEQAHAAYRERDPAKALLASIPDRMLESLAARFSYSSSPLDPATRTRLLELLQSMTRSMPGGVYAMPRTPEFIDRARTIVQPAQLAALEELRTEYEAAWARSRLPKSSELPRTTRRQRLEANAR